MVSYQRIKCIFYDSGLKSLLAFDYPTFFKTRVKLPRNLNNLTLLQNKQL